MKTGIAVAAILFMLPACAGTQNHLRVLEAGGDIRVAPSAGPDHDFVVSIRNTRDFGYDPDDKATRDNTALALLASQCQRARVVGETVIETGTFALGNPSRTYAIRVKCG